MGLEAMVVECGKRLAKMSTKGLPGGLKSSLRSLAPPFMWHLITIATYPAILKQRKPSHRYPVIGQFLTQSVGWSIQLPICTASGLEMDGVWSIGQATYLFLDRQGRRGSWFSCLRMLRDKSSRQDLYHIL